MAKQNCLIFERALCGDNLFLKCSAFLLGVRWSGQVMFVNSGRSSWYLASNREVVFMVGLNKLATDGCKRIGSRSILNQNLCLVYLIAEFMVMMKSVAAQWQGNSSPRPPRLVLRWLINLE